MVIVDQVENQLNSIKDETLDYTSRCATEARQLVENFEAESHNVDVVEKEARELVEVSLLFSFDIEANSMFILKQNGACKINIWFDLAFSNKNITYSW